MKKNIVVLDSLPLDSGDIDWSRLEALGELKVYKQTDAAVVKERIASAHIVLTSKVKFTEELIAAAPNLEYIGVTATGYDNVDLASATKAGIVVTNIPSYSTDSVAELIFAFILECAKKTALHNQSVHQDGWVNSAIFAYFKSSLAELADKTIGIIGLGHIGLRVAELAEAFKMKIVVYVPRAKPRPNLKEIRFVALEELYAEADYLVFACPATLETIKMINAKSLKLMKSSAYLINTSRGALIDEEALADALNNGQIAGAALDVLAVEPPLKDNPLLTSKNTLITPHIAWGTYEARQRMYDILVTNLAAFLNGKPVNNVNQA